MSNLFAGKTYAFFPNDGNRKIVSGLQSAGAEIIQFPVLEAEIFASEFSIEISKKIKNFDWLIFPDVLTVEFFLEILETNQIDFFDLDEIRICALGEIVSDRLRFVQIHADVIPNTVETENVLFALQSYVAPGEFKKLKFLLLNQNQSANEIKSKLIEREADVFELPVYQINFANKIEIPRLKALVKGGAIDEFIFCAPTDFIALNDIFNGESLPEVFSGMEITAIDGLMFQTMREHNLKPTGLFQLEKVDKI